jgi:hypothetical protein
MRSGIAVFAFLCLGFALRGFEDLFVFVELFFQLSQILPSILPRWQGSRTIFFELGADLVALGFKCRVQIFFYILPLIGKINAS